MKEKTRILFIVQHRLNRSPGQRYRFEQYLPYLIDAGFEYTYSPLIADKNEEEKLYVSKKISGKLIIFIKGFFRRLRDISRAKNYGLVFIYRDAFYTGTVFFEKMLKRSGAKIVLDFDDAIWLSTVSEVNRSLQWLKRPDKVKEIIALSDKVITGNKYLADYARRYNQNVAVFPSTIDMNYYRLDKPKDASFKKPGDIITIGWSGSHTTIEYFETLLPVLKKLKKKLEGKINFAVYGDPFYRNDELGITGIAWSPETEVEVISSFDIGVMPMPDDEWTRGKCAMKGLQYMGLEVPAVVAAVGVNNEIVEDGVNGFKAANEAEWLEKLTLLIEDASLRTKIGAAGRKTVEEKFSCQKLKDDYINILLSLSNQTKQIK